MRKGSIEEMRGKMELLNTNISMEKNGSVRQIMLMEIRKELQELIDTYKPRLHVAEDSLCESCE